MENIALIGIDLGKNSFHIHVLHPWPVERFTARHPRQEPGA